MLAEELLQQANIQYSVMYLPATASRKPNWICTFVKDDIKIEATGFSRDTAIMSAVAKMFWYAWKRIEDENG